MPCLGLVSRRCRERLHRSSQSPDSPDDNFSETIPRHCDVGPGHAHRPVVCDSAHRRVVHDPIHARGDRDGDRGAAIPAARASARSPRSAAAPVAGSWAEPTRTLGEARLRGRAEAGRALGTSGPENTPGSGTSACSTRVTSCSSASSTARVGTLQRNAICVDLALIVRGDGAEPQALTSHATRGGEWGWVRLRSEGRAGIIKPF